MRSLWNEGYFLRATYLTGEVCCAGDVTIELFRVTPRVQPGGRFWCVDGWSLHIVLRPQLISQ